MVTVGEERYGFGANWAEFVGRAFSERRLEIAQADLLGFLRLSSLEGKSFLDIGCGSGIHSFAAWRAGAKSVHSFDYDLDSVRTTERLRALAGKPANWIVEQGSVLERNYMAALPKADVVYSWGVLHHTGRLWTAVEHAALPMHERSMLYLALYCTDVYVRTRPEYWLSVKRRYNRAGTLRKRMMEYGYMARRWLLPHLLRGKNPMRYVRDYRHQRGMDFKTDVRDWLGGWPMEFAALGETKTFCRDSLGLELVNVVAGEACAEYLFRRQGADNYWDDYLAALPALKPLPLPYEAVGGRCYRARLPEEAGGGDSSTAPRRSDLMLYEDGVPIGFGHARFADIRRYGGGRYSHWDGDLFFSATDSGDPRTNGREYTYRILMLPGAASASRSAA